MLLAGRGIRNPGPVTLQSRWVHLDPHRPAGGYSVSLLRGDFNVTIIVR
jgi:hypothetical protein